MKPFVKRGNGRTLVGNDLGVTNNPHNQLVTQCTSLAKGIAVPIMHHVKATIHVDTNGFLVASPALPEHSKLARVCTQQWHPHDHPSHHARHHPFRRRRRLLGHRLVTTHFPSLSLSFSLSRCRCLCITASSPSSFVAPHTNGMEWNEKRSELELRKQNIRHWCDNSNSKIP